MSAPRVPAAFINALAEEGTKAEAIDYLQKVWDEKCALERELADLRAERDALKRIHGVPISMRWDILLEEYAKLELEGAAMNKDALLLVLKDLRRAYVRLLENARDRIVELGGQCDSVELMERGDTNLRDVDKAITAALEDKSAERPEPLPDCMVGPSEPCAGYTTLLAYADRMRAERDALKRTLDKVTRS